MKSELLNILSKHDNQRIALSDNVDCHLSYADLIVEVSALVNWLSRNEIQGVATILDNSPAYVVLDLALLEAGVFHVPIPPFFTEPQIRNALVRSGCQWIIKECTAGPIKEADSLEIEIAGVRLQVARTGITDDTHLHDLTAKVTFTSGSTGFPRGLCLSEAQLLAPSHAIAQSWDTHDAFTHLSVLPFAVLLENVAGVYSTLIAGAGCNLPKLATLGWQADGNINAKTLLESVSNTSTNSIIVVPEIVKSLIREAESGVSISPSLQTIAVGGAVTDSKLLTKAHQLGLPVVEGYGLSEAGSVVSVNLHGANRVGSVGRVLNHQNVIVAEDGELLLEEAGYLGTCDSSEPPKKPFPTGDLGYIDSEGYLFIRGRKKSMIVTSMGRNVSPDWVESRLCAHGEVAQAFVYGDTSMAIFALVCSNLNDQQLLTYINSVNATLPQYANITHWSRVPPFTVSGGLLTGNGKLKRQAICEQYKLQHND